MLPTPAGTVAVDLARDTLARLHTLQARLASFAELTSGELRLSAFPSANIVLVSEAIRRFASAYPEVALSLLHTDQSTPLAAVYATGRLAPVPGPAGGQERPR